MLDEKKVSFSGVQPSGNLTIGNYLGAIKNFSEYSEQYKCFYCVVDQHAITVRQIPAELRRRTYETLALYIACGLDPEKNTLYVQSHVPAHTEMAWMLDCFTRPMSSRLASTRSSTLSWRAILPSASISFIPAHLPYPSLLSQSRGRR